MILFKSFLIEQILAGNKKETRRKVKTKEGKIVKPRWKPGSIHWAVHKYYQKEPDCKIKIHSVHMECLRDITPENVKNEGFPDGNVENFIKGYYAIENKIKLEEKKLDSILAKISLPGDYNPRVWVIKFEIAKQDKFLPLFDLSQKI